MEKNAKRPHTTTRRNTPTQHPHQNTIRLLRNTTQHNTTLTKQRKIPKPHTRTLQRTRTHHQIPTKTRIQSNKPRHTSTTTPRPETTKLPNLQQETSRGHNNQPTIHPCHRIRNTRTKTMHRQNCNATQTTIPRNNNKIRENIQTLTTQQGPRIRKTCKLHKKQQTSKQWGGGLCASHGTSGTHNP